jgi:hypothetical protein
MYKRLLILVILVLVVLIPSHSIYAAAPVKESGSMDLDYPIDYQVCPGIEVWDHEVLTYQQTVFFDNQGNPTIVKVLYQGVDHFYNKQNPNFVLSGKFTGTLEFDPYTGEAIGGFGVPWHLTVPGYGTVLVRAGLWSNYPDMHLAGKDSFNDPKDVAAFCSLLAVD